MDSFKSTCPVQKRPFNLLQLLPAATTTTTTTNDNNNNNKDKEG